MNRVLSAAGPELNTHQEIPGIALLHPEPEEGDLVLGGEFEADPAAHHRDPGRVHGEGGEGHEVGGLQEVDLHLEGAGRLPHDGVVRRHGADLLPGEAGVVFRHHRVVTCLGYEAMAGRIAGDGLPARGNEGVGRSAHLDRDRNTIFN